MNRKAIAKRICPCIPLEHGDNELEISGEDILVDGLIKKGKGENQLEVAIGDGMEFTIHGDLKNKGKKSKLMNNTKVSGLHSLKELARHKHPRARIAAAQHVETCDSTIDTCPHHLLISIS